MIATVFALGAAGCGDDHPGDVLDASTAPDAYVFVDAAPLSDGDSLAWVDFATSGCTLTVIDGVAECTGQAPLRVRFAPIAPGVIVQALWTFGDGEVSATLSPDHEFLLPGRYDVSLAISGPGGSAAAARAGFIVVTAAPLGAACSDSRQCGDERTCLCGDGVACDGGWAAGACTAACDVDPCDDGACAQLGGDAPWSGAWCLPACAGGCAPGRACTSVPGDAGWIDACAPAGALAAIGESCSGAAGPDDARCASGDCEALGLRGACSAACSVAAPCPTGTTCVTFTGGLGAQCVADCDAVVCDDPWLGCVAPGGAGDLGFTGGSAAETYCAPEPCLDSGACPAGTCSGGYCRP